MVIGRARIAQGVCRLHVRGLVLGTAAVICILSTAACTGSAPRRPSTSNTIPTIPAGAEAPRITGWLRTTGATIVDGQGNDVRLLSIGIHGLEIGNGLPTAQERARSGCVGWRAPLPPTYAAVHQSGFNSVRLAVSWANLEPTPPTIGPNGALEHHWNKPYVEAIDATIAGFRSQGIAVVLDMHQRKWSPAFEQIPNGARVTCQGAGMPAWLYPGQSSSQLQDAKCAFFANTSPIPLPIPSVQDGFADAWTFLARRYVDDPAVVGADVLNEPYGNSGCMGPALRLDDLYAKIGAAIRQANPKLMLIFEDSQYSASNSYGMTRRPPFANEVYSFHIYGPAWTPDGQRVTQAFVARAAAFGMPGWIGEFNRFGKPTAPPAGWNGQLQDMLTYCRQQGVGWSYWAYNGSDPLVDQKTDQVNLKLLDALRTGF
jgi:hypothetical protein